MKRTHIYLDVYFLLLIMELFSLATMLLINMKELTLVEYLLFGLCFLIVIIAYFTSLIMALTVSMFGIFLLGSLAVYQSIFGGIVIPNSYSWLIILPLTAFIAGRFSVFLSELKSSLFQLEDQVQLLVMIDENTGFYGEKAFYRDLEEEMSLAKRHRFDLPLMLLEIQYLEELIRMYGRKKADEIIKVFSDQLRIASRLGDKRYRINEKQFAMIMPYTDSSGGDIVRERLRSTLSSIRINDKESYQLSMKISIVLYNDAFPNPLAFKRAAEKELEFDL
jgi:diguanylate cyclase (GGDEF)-like protein